MFTAICSKSEIRVIGDDMIASGTQRLISVCFQFSGDWDRVPMRIAQFSINKKNIISVPIEESCIVEVPWELLQMPKNTVYVGVYGVGNDGSRLPTIWCSLCYVAKGVPSSVTEGMEPTPNYLDRLAEIVEDANKVGESAYDIAVRNGFHGTEQEWIDSLGYPEELVRKLILSFVEWGEFEHRVSVCYDSK